ncbi:MAG: SCP2 sterol-binding domain-containing protein [Polyangiales bacterium]
MSEPIAFLRDEFPALFRRGVDLLRERATTEPAAKRALDDVLGARGAALLRFDGMGDVWLSVENGEMRASDVRPADFDAELAVSVPGEAAEVALDTARGERDLRSPEIALGVARMVSARVQAAVRGENLSFVLTIRDTPDFEAVPVRVAFGADAPPDKPRFTVDVRYADLERVERGELKPQQFFMGGKMKFGGDYARALQIAMKLAEPPRR